MPTLIVTVPVLAQDRPARPLAQALREIADVIETPSQITPAASWTHLDRILRTSKATWTYA
jgi:hypothetical protein